MCLVGFWFKTRLCGASTTAPCSGGNLCFSRSVTRSHICTCLFLLLEFSFMEVFQGFSLPPEHTIPLASSGQSHVPSIIQCRTQVRFSYLGKCLYSVPRCRPPSWVSLNILRSFLATNIIRHLYGLLCDYMSKCWFFTGVWCKLGVDPVCSGRP